MYSLLFLQLGCVLKLYFNCEHKAMELRFDFIVYFEKSTVKRCTYILNISIDVVP